MYCHTESKQRPELEDIFQLGELGNGRNWGKTHARHKATGRFVSTADCEHYVDRSIDLPGTQETQYSQSQEEQCSQMLSQSHDESQRKISAMFEEPHVASDSVLAKHLNTTRMTLQRQRCRVANLCVKEWTNQIQNLIEKIGEAAIQVPGISIPSWFDIRRSDETPQSLWDGIASLMQVQLHWGVLVRFDGEMPQVREKSAQKIEWAKSTIQEEQQLDVDMDGNVGNNEGLDGKALQIPNSSPTAPAKYFFIRTELPTWLLKMQGKSSRVHKACAERLGKEVWTKTREVVSTVKKLNSQRRNGKKEEIGCQSRLCPREYRVVCTDGDRACIKATNVDLDRNPELRARHNTCDIHADNNAFKAMVGLMSGFAGRMCRYANMLAMRGNVDKVISVLERRMAKVKIYRDKSGPSLEADEYREAVYDCFWVPDSEITPGELRRKTIVRCMLNGDIRKKVPEHYCYGDCCEGGNKLVTIRILVEEVVPAIMNRTPRFFNIHRWNRHDKPLGDVGRPVFLHGFYTGGVFDQAFESDAQALRREQTQNRKNWADAESQAELHDRAEEGGAESESMDWKANQAERTRVCLKWFSHEGTAMFEIALMTLVSLPYKASITRQLYSGGVRWEHVQKEREAKGLHREYRVVADAIGTNDLLFLRDTGDLLRMRRSALCGSALIVYHHTGPQTLRKQSVAFRLTMRILGFRYARIIRKHQLCPTRLFLAAEELLPPTLRAVAQELFATLSPCTWDPFTEGFMKDFKTAAHGTDGAAVLWAMALEAEQHMATLEEEHGRSRRRCGRKPLGKTLSAVYVMRRALRRKDRLALQKEPRVLGETEKQGSEEEVPKDHSEATVKETLRGSNAKKQRLIRVQAQAARAQSGRGYGAYHLWKKRNWKKYEQHYPELDYIDLNIIMGHDWRQQTPAQRNHYEQVKQKLKGSNILVDYQAIERRLHNNKYLYYHKGKRHGTEYVKFIKALHGTKKKRCKTDTKPLSRQYGSYLHSKVSAAMHLIDRKRREAAAKETDTQEAVTKLGQSSAEGLSDLRGILGEAIGAQLIPSGQRVFDYIAGDEPHTLASEYVVNSLINGNRLPRDHVLESLAAGKYGENEEEWAEKHDIVKAQEVNPEDWSRKNPKKNQCCEAGFCVHGKNAYIGKMRDRLVHEAQA